MKSTYIQQLNNKNEISGENPEDVYKRPIPIDTINKFWGVDSRMLKHDETVQRQSFDQASKHFWSFVDFNVMFKNGQENLNDQFNGSINKGTGNKFTQSESKSKSFNSSNSDLNNGGKSNLSYQDARRRANELLEKSK